MYQCVSVCLSLCVWVCMHVCGCVCVLVLGKGGHSPPQQKRHGLTQDGGHPSESGADAQAVHRAGAHREQGAWKQDHHAYRVHELVHRWVRGGDQGRGGGDSAAWQTE